jgi:ABC-type glycerol-3-phosphate transport system substrate-binding protein
MTIFVARRRVLALMTAASLGAMLAGCGEQTDDAGSSSWSVPSEDPTATVALTATKPIEEMQPVIDAFEEAHPTITVDYQYVNGKDLDKVLDARISSKTGTPDVFWVDQPRVAGLVARSYLEPLTPFADLVDGLESASIEASSLEGTLYSLPIADSTQVLYYNKDLLESAGVALPSADPTDPITWQQLREDAETVQRAGATYGLLFGQPNYYYQLQPLIYSAGGGDGAADGDAVTPDVNNEGWVEAMDFYGSLFERGITPRGFTQGIYDTFAAGSTGYIIEGNWFVGTMANSSVNWGAAAHPVWEGGEQVTPTGGWSIGMNPFSKEKEAAAILMKFLALDEGGGYVKYRAFAELSPNIEGRAAYLDSELFTGSEGGQQASAVVAYQTENTARPRLVTPGFIEFDDILNRAFSDISNGTDPTSALDSAQEQLESAWARYADLD